MSVTIDELSPRTNSNEIPVQCDCCQETAKRTDISNCRCEGMLRAWWAAAGRATTGRLPDFEGGPAKKESSISALPRQCDVTESPSK